MYLNDELYKFLASVTDADMTSIHCWYLDLLLLFCVIITRTGLCVHTWSAHGLYVCKYIAMLCICREFHGVSML